MPRYTPDEAIYVEGPWTHRDISANGARFHIVTAGTGPTVLLLHGFPTYWWTWRKLIPQLAAAGYRVVAMDLRGYGGSDHPPRGYDMFSLSHDVAGVIRSLGVRNATVIGHGIGGLNDQLDRGTISEGVKPIRTFLEPSLFQFLGRGLRIVFAHVVFDVGLE